MASFFKNITTIEDLKKTYKSLALKHHPDHGGSEETMKEINIQYDAAVRFISIASPSVSNGTPSYGSYGEFYTPYGWKGENYDSRLSNKDIAIRIRTFLKMAFPKCRFSVTSDYYHIYVVLMKADFNPFTSEFKPTRGNHIDVNHYHIDNDDRLTDYAKVMFNLINDFICSYRYDDSDSMVDYFNTNFYYDLGIGKWDKDFVQTADNHYSSSMEVKIA